MFIVKPNIFNLFLLLLTFSSYASATLIEYSGSAIVTNVNDDTEHYISLSITFDDNLIIHGRPMPPIHERLSDEHPAHFSIPSYYIDIDKLGTFYGYNGRLNMWYDEDPYTRNIYPEEMAIFAGHGFVSFHNSDGRAYDWSSWRGDNPSFNLPPVIFLHTLDVFDSNPDPDNFRIENGDVKLTTVPIHGTIWLFSFGLLGLLKAMQRRYRGLG
jgi:hypothetical protein